MPFSSLYASTLPPILPILSDSSYKSGLWSRESGKLLHIPPRSVISMARESPIFAQVTTPLGLMIIDTAVVPENSMSNFCFFKSIWVCVNHSSRIFTFVEDCLSNSSNGFELLAISPSGQLTLRSWKLESDLWS